MSRADDTPSAALLDSDAILGDETGEVAAPAQDRAAFMADAEEVLRGIKTYFSIVPRTLDRLASRPRTEDVIRELTENKESAADLKTRFDALTGFSNRARAATQSLNELLFSARPETSRTELDRWRRLRDELDEWGNAAARGIEQVGASGLFKAIEGDEKKATKPKQERREPIARSPLPNRRRMPTANDLGLAPIANRKPGRVPLDDPERPEWLDDVPRRATTVSVALAIGVALGWMLMRFVDGQSLLP